MKSIFLIGLTALLFLFAGCQQSDTPEPDAVEVPIVPDLRPQAATVDGPAPDFSVPGLQGDTLRLSDFKGKTIVLNFWATWCGPCIVEIPDLIALQEELGHDSFAVIGLSMDMTGIEDVQQFAESMEINYPIGMDDGDVAQAFGGVYSLPTTYIIDKEGQIKRRTIGIFPAEAFKPHLISMIKGD